jgi:transposase
MEETIVVDPRTQRRLHVLNHVLAGALTAAQAAQLLELSLRQVRRLLAHYRADGVAALVHGNRGRPPPNRLAPELRVRLVELASSTYAGVNRAHLAELLAEREAIVVAERSLRRVLAEAGLPAVRRRRAPRHRSRRERMPRAGLLLQVDGSRHAWLEDRGPLLTLVGGIDDASGIVTGAIFREQEDAAGYFAVLTQTAAGYGLPAGLYSDRHGIFWRDRRRPPSLAEQLAGRHSPTQVGRALEEAGIAWIAARSPQAKGRVERLWGTWQDRLRVELRLAAATTMADANQVLAAHLPRHNARFALAPADPVSAWRPLAAGQRAEAIFCFAYPRRVAADATVRLDGQVLALLERPDRRSWAGRRVMVQERLDGSRWAMADADDEYLLSAAPPEPVTLRARGGSRTPLAHDRSPVVRPQQPEPVAPAMDVTPRRPAADHPWRSSHTGFNKRR